MYPCRRSGIPWAIIHLIHLLGPLALYRIGRQLGKDPIIVLVIVKHSLVFVQPILSPVLDYRGIVQHQQMLQRNFVVLVHNRQGQFQGLGGVVQVLFIIDFWGKGLGILKAYLVTAAHIQNGLAVQFFFFLWGCHGGYKGQKQRWSDCFFHISFYLIVLEFVRVKNTKLI